MRLVSLCIDTVEDRKFLDTPFVHVHVHAVTMHDSTHHACMTNYDFTSVNFV